MEGFEEGAFSGAIGGAIFGGLGAAGQAIGKGISCISKIGKFIKGLSIVSGAVSSGMAVFDLFAMVDLLIDGDNNWLYEMNQKLHSSTAYNYFQMGASALAVFTGGMSQTMTCFVAGTMILTAAGLTAIEHIKAGDKVISTDPATFETAEKSVLETYVRQTDKLIHLVIGGEEIITKRTVKKGTRCRRSRPRSCALFLMITILRKPVSLSSFRKYRKKESHMSIKTG